MQRYLEQAAYLHAGKAPAPRPSRDQLSVKILCSQYLDHQESRAEIGEMESRHVSDQISLLRDFVKFIGPNRPVSDISTIELQNYRKKLIRAEKSRNTVNNRIAAVKTMYNWALDNEVIDNAPGLKAVEKVTARKQKRPTFAASQIHKMLQNAIAEMKAMIWLGLNCGFGCTDCGELKWKNVDLQNGRVDFPRGKTPVGRNLPLWSETVRALKEIPVSGELVLMVCPLLLVLILI